MGDGKISIQVSVNESRDKSLNLCGKLVSNDTLDEGLNEVSNFGDTITLKVNDDVIFFDDEINISGLDCSSQS